MTESIPGVTEIIAERIKSGSKPWKRNDPWKVALIPEGGSMRGVISGGAGIYLQSINAFEAFDACFATSAGACTIFYLAANQTPEGTSVYYQDINNSEFIDPWKVFKRKPPIDMRFLTHEVMMKRKILDWQKVVDSPIPLHTYATEARNVKALDLYPFTDKDSVHNAALYSCLMPVVAGLPEKAGEYFLADGAISTGNLPIQNAIDDGCTHILVTLTRPEEATKRLSSKFDPIIALILKRSGFGQLAKGYIDSYKIYSQNLQMICANQNSNGLPRIEAISTRIPEISRVEKNAGVLRNGAIAGYEAAWRKFRKFNLPQKADVTVI